MWATTPLGKPKPPLPHPTYICFFHNIVIHACPLHKLQRKQH